MIWIILWAGLLIVVLYSPVGSPGLYSSQNYFVVNQLVTVNKGTILNSPKAKYASETNSNVLAIPDITSELNSTHSKGSYQSGKSSFVVSSYGSTQTPSYQNNNVGSGGINGGGSFIASGGSRSSSAGSSGITMTNGIAAISTTSVLSNTTKQSTTSEDTPITLGNTGPGDDPTGDTIPVGDGWGILFIFGAVYILIKKKNLFLKIRKATH